VITSRSAALVAGRGSWKTVPASNGSKSKHEHAPSSDSFIFLEKRDVRSAYYAWVSG